MNQFPPRKFATTVNDTGGKFATGVNDTGGNFATSFNSVVDTGGKFELRISRRIFDKI
jgi:hypothetical protein